MDSKQLKYIIEAALLGAGRPLTLDKLQGLFGKVDRPARQDVRAAIMELKADYAGRGIEVTEIASGFRIQVRSSMTHHLEPLWEERPPRYSRALLETLSIIAYRQPVTRGEIEDIRGVAVSTNIIRTLLERSWIQVVGHRDVPGKPAMFGTTKEFLDYFDLKKLEELPPLAELKDFDKLNVQLDLQEGEIVDRPEEPGNVASLADARAAATAAVEPPAGDDEDTGERFRGDELDGDEESAKVVPLKQP